MTLRNFILAACVAAAIGGGVMGQTFTNVTSSSGISVGTSTWSFRGAAWADFNGDGAIDLFAPSADTGPVTLYYNLGGGAFSPAVVVPNASTSTRRDNYCIAGDVDNDGDEDVFLCQGNATPPGTRANQLWINDGGGNFTESAAAWGLNLVANSFCASFGDYDRDGWLDLVLGVYGYTGSQGGTYVLYHNNRNGTFTNTTVAAGIFGITANAFAVAFADYDRDQWPDIWCANDLGTTLGGAAMMLYRNNRNGTFTNVSAAANVSYFIDGMGITVADVQNDGDWDTFVTNISTGHVLFLMNGATGAFQTGAAAWSIANSNGITAAGGTGWSCKFFDYNNDALNDLWVMQSVGANQLYRGNASGALFTNQASVLGIGVALPTGWGSCVVDFDDDGRLDIYSAGSTTTAQLAKNNVVNSNHWIKLKLVGTNSNKSGIGAVAIVRANSIEQRRQVISGEGFLVDGDKRLHFGIGTATTINEIEVRWPSGTVQYIANPAIDQVLTVTEPAIQIAGSMTPGSTSTLTYDYPSDLGLVYVSAMVLNVAAEFYLPDTRAIRVDVNDPAIQLTTTLGNPYFGFFTGVIGPGGQATSQITFPPIPQLTGLGAYLIGVTVSGFYPGNIKSIIGPQRFTIN